MKFSGWSLSLFPFGRGRLSRFPCPPRSYPASAGFIGIKILNCSAHAKVGLKWPQVGPGVFFPANPDLANIWGRTDFDFEDFHFLDVVSQISRFPDPISRFLDFPIPRFPHGRPGAGGRAVWPPFTRFGCYV